MKILRKKIDENRIYLGRNSDTWGEGSGFRTIQSRKRCRGIGKRQNSKRIHETQNTEEIQNKEEILHSAAGK